jgi:hypothetical protein
MGSITDSSCLISGRIKAKERDMEILGKEE